MPLATIPVVLPTKLTFNSLGSIKALFVSKRAFTLPELLVCIGVILILAVAVVTVSGKLVQSAAKPKCLANLKSLHTAFSAYVQDKGMWPQLPEAKAGQENLADLAMMTLMDPYTDSRKVWVCPALERARLKQATGEDIKMHYMTTRFDANRISPFRWPRQPWLIEIADAHGGGPLILLPDGSVTGLKDLLTPPRRQ